MSSISPGYDDVPVGPAEEIDVARKLTGLWWLWLVAGICWIVASLVILQFDTASITTIGIITGILFTVAGLQQLTLAFVADSLKWVWAIFGVIFLIAGGVCFVNPTDTFAGLADMLGFLFLTVGVWWTIRAFFVREVDSAWWLGLVAGILMIVLAFWTSGQFFIHKAYTLVVFAGIWALMEGITQIFRAFAMRSVHKAL
ncbi:MAG TPA: DUF308 domain-containing protein [Thermoleophilaceae bacterium]|nr:DUF308 domain-containing protein [Thermoleophilaceae bacterium]